MTGQDKRLQILLAEDNPMDVLVTRESLKLWKIKRFKKDK